MSEPEQEKKFGIWRHVMIGVPGSPRDDSTISRTSWKVEPFTASRAVPPIERVWTDEEWQTIRRGHLPADMDDKWFAFVEDDCLYLCRSWTGDTIFQARFEPREQGWRIADAVTEDREQPQPQPQPRESGDPDALLLELLIDTVLLGTYDHARWEQLWDAEG